MAQLTFCLLLSQRCWSNIFCGNLNEQKLCIIGFCACLFYTEVPNASLLSLFRPQGAKLGFYVLIAFFSSLVEMHLFEGKGKDQKSSRRRDSNQEIYYN